MNTLWRSDAMTRAVYTPVFRQNAANFTSTSNMNIADGGDDLDESAMIATSTNFTGVAKGPDPRQPSDSKGPGTVATLILNTLNDINKTQSRSPEKSIQSERKGGFSLQAYIEKTTGMSTSSAVPASAPRIEHKKQPTMMETISPAFNFKFNPAETPGSVDNNDSIHMSSGSTTIQSDFMATTAPNVDQPEENKRRKSGVGVEGEFSFASPEIIEELDYSPIDVRGAKEVIGADEVGMNFVFSPPSKPARRSKLLPSPTSSAKASSTAAEQEEKDKNAAPVAASTTATGGLSIWAMASNKWKCEVCMVQNEQSAIKCVCCEAPKGAPPVMGGAPEPKPFAGFGNGNSNSNSGCDDGKSAATGGKFSFGTAASSSVVASAPSPFTFSAAPVAKITTTTTSAINGGFKFGVPPSSSSSSSSSTAMNAPTFGLSAPSIGNKGGYLDVSNLPKEADKPKFNINNLFGPKAAKSSSSNTTVAASAIVNTTAAPSSSLFSFGVKKDAPVSPNDQDSASVVSNLTSGPSPSAQATATATTTTAPTNPFGPTTNTLSSSSSSLYFSNPFAGNSPPFRGEHSHGGQINTGR